MAMHFLPWLLKHQTFLVKTSSVPRCSNFPSAKHTMSVLQCQATPKYLYRMSKHRLLSMSLIQHLQTDVKWSLQILSILVTHNCLSTSRPSTPVPADTPVILNKKQVTNSHPHLWTTVFLPNGLDKQILAKSKQTDTETCS